MIWFENAYYTGTVKPANQNSQFMIISGVDENAQGFDKCSKVKAWNGYYCENSKLALFTFESFDDDKYKRILSPINVQSMNLTSRNVLNTFMDHLWDGFYTSMLRLSRFATLF